MKNPVVVVLFWAAALAYMAELHLVFYFFAAATVVGLCIVTIKDTRKDRIWDSVARLIIAAVLFAYGPRPAAVFIALLAVLPLAAAEGVQVWQSSHRPGRSPR